VACSLYHRDIEAAVSPLIVTRWRESRLYMGRACLDDDLQVQVLYLDGVLSCKVLVEAAEALKLNGYQVAIIELLDWFMSTLFCEGAARFLEDKMLGYGIEVFTSEKVLSIEGDGSVALVKTDKQEIPCDTVVVATGVVPGRPLAETAGVACDRSLLVYDRMKTAEPGTGLYDPVRTQKYQAAQRDQITSQKYEEE